jgi:hypothetical protein
LPQYLIVRQFEVGEDGMPEVGRRSRSLIENDFPEITWHYSHVTLDDSGRVKTFCVYDGPSEEAIRQHADELGLHEVQSVQELVGDVTPEDFPPNPA